MGLVSQVFDESALDSLPGTSPSAMPATRLRVPATGPTPSRHSATATGHVALGHNGNLTNTAELAEIVGGLAAKSGELPFGSQQVATTDTDLVTALLAAHPGTSLTDAAVRGVPLGCRAPSRWCSWTRPPVCRPRPAGIRPLVIGELERGWVVASETAALDIVGARFLRDVEPGELVTIDENGPKSQRFAPRRRSIASSSTSILARPDSSLDGHGGTRRGFGGSGVGP